MLNESIHVRLKTYIRKTISIKDSVVKINLINLKQKTNEINVRVNPIHYQKKKKSRQKMTDFFVSDEIFY